MAGAESPRRRGQPLTDSDAVVDAGYPRRLQERGAKLECTLPKEFCRAMGLTTQGQTLDVKRVTGAEPVVIEEEAIVIRPHPNGTGGGGGGE